MDLQRPARVKALTRGATANPEPWLCAIMDLERTFERRWAARFSGPAKEHRFEEQHQHQQVTAPDESKTRRRGTGGLAMSRALSPRTAFVSAIDSGRFSRFGRDHGVVELANVREPR